MRDVRFLVTDECARLARWLRLCGYDTVDMPAQPLSALYPRAYAEGRIVVTRNRRVQASCLFRIVHLEGTQLADQLRQITRDLALRVEREAMFARCDRCNVPVESIEKARVKDRVPPYVFQTQQAFHACPLCQRVYWRATHCERVRAIIGNIAP